MSTGGPASYVAFVPADLPRLLPLEPATVTALSNADSNLGRLADHVSRSRDRPALVAPGLARASSVRCIGFCSLAPAVKNETPGELRVSQNWIGTDNPATALFVPPTVEHMKPALSDWEIYIHDEKPQLPLLIRTALLHYQFETIHPFLDGNGRLGRHFVVLCLVERQAIPAPLLPLSAALERQRHEDYDRESWKPRSAVRGRRPSGERGRS